MKTGHLIKAMKESDIAREMELVNHYSRRQLTEDEVYLFSVVLCDNDIDRDGERFTVEALFKLEELFVGKTGIIDHEPKAGNMKARIISCRVEAVEGRKTALGDEYFRLIARAYIPRTDSNRALIEAIDAGIIKEVSVGCAVQSTTCSICSHEMHSSACTHIRGREYGGKLCYGELSRPTDAYEFSFVAVPAQREAGVIKAYQRKDRNMKELLKALREQDEMTLQKSEMTKLCTYIDTLEQSAQDGRLYREQLQREVLMSVTASATLNADTARNMLKKLSTSELKELGDALSMKKAQQIKPQLISAKETKPEVKNTQFTI